MIGNIQLSRTEREIMLAIRRMGPIGRADLTDVTSLSQQSIHRIVERLALLGLLRYGAAIIRGRGKPSTELDVNGDRFSAYGISINTDSVRFCAVDLTGKILQNEDLNVVPHSVEFAIEQLKLFMERHRQSQAALSDTLGIGVALQGYRTSPRDEFYPPDALHAWRGIPIIDAFRQAFNVPVFVENNASASALAESTMVADASNATIAYLAFNHGFGAGVVSNGNVMLGAHGNAAEISSIYTLQQAELRPALGKLILRLRDGGEPISSLNDLRSHLNIASPIVAEWIDDIRPQLHMALRALKAIVDPKFIFFGGDAPQSLRELFIAASDGAFETSKSPNPKLQVSAIEGDAAQYGAALFPLNALIY